MTHKRTRPAPPAELLRRPESLGAVLRPMEAVVIAAALLVGLAVFQRWDGFERFVAFVHSFEAAELDELLFIMLLGGVAALVIAIRRASELHCEIRTRALAERRAHEMSCDPLTGLPQRKLLLETMSQAIADDNGFAVLLIDLDKFKPVNDLHGHEAGDRVLIEVAERLCGIDERLYVCRLGGDEFVCILQGAHDRGALERVTAEILRQLHLPMAVAGRSLTIGATIGIARFPEDGFADAKGLLRAADLAMYAAKEARRGTHVLFHPGLAARARERAELENQIREALATGKIKPYFQQVVDLASGQVSGFEALARWEHPERGLIEPAAFLPIVEDLDLGEELLAAVLRGAAEAEVWRADTNLRVNVCGAQLRDPLFPSKLLLFLSEIGLDPRRLIVEVTEDALSGALQQVSATFAALRAAGVRMALDDFGKSYSNLSSLRELKFDHLKIHGSFLKSADDPARNVVHAVVALARELGMPAVAQGIEKPEHAALAKNLACSHGQGFHFGRAEPATGNTLHKTSGRADEQMNAA